MQFELSSYQRWSVAVLFSAVLGVIAVQIPAQAACTNPATIPSGFTAPCPVFSLSSTSLTQAQTLTLSAAPQAGTDYIYTQAYVSNGTTWNPYTLAGNNAYLSYSSALASLTLSSAQLSSLSLGTHYAVSWDWLWDATANCYKGPGLNQCNTGTWRVQAFTLASTYAYSQSTYYAYSQSAYYVYSQSAYVTPTPTPTPSPSSLMAAYAFNEGSSGTTVDNSGNGHTGSLVNAVWTTAEKFGNALSFNGSSAYVEVPDSDTLTPSNLTFSADVKLTSYPASDVVSIFNKWASDGLTTSNDEYALSLLPSGQLQFCWHTAGGNTWGSTSYNCAQGTGAIPLNTMTHVAVVRSGTSILFYQNGNLDATLTNVIDTNPFRNGTASLRIGAQNRGVWSCCSSRYLSGIIDEVRIEGTALTQSQIQTDMNTPIGGASYTYSQSSYYAYSQSTYYAYSQSTYYAYSQSAYTSGTVYYVSPYGNDANSGTNSSAPWRTIQKAMNSAIAGSTVNIMAGTYNERLTMNVQGTAGNYITFQPYGFSVPSGGCGGYTGTPCGGDQVILDYAYLGTVTDGVPFFLISGKSYIRVQGLTFQNYTTNEQTLGNFSQGLRIDGSSSYIEFKYNKFLHNHEIGPHTGCCAFGHIRIDGPSNNVWFYGNELGDIWTSYSEALTADSNAQYITVEDNYIHDTDAIGIDMHGGTNNYTVRHNKLEYISIKRSDGSVWYGNPSVAIYNDGGNTGVMERNFVDHAGVGFQALSETGQPASHDVTIRNNIVQNSNQNGIVLGTWYSSACNDSTVYNISAYNNTFYGNSTGVVIRPMQYGSLKWENNIFANNGNTHSDQSGCSGGVGIGTANYNIFYGSGGGVGSNVLTSDPSFVSASTENFALQSTSPAINSGDPSTPSSLAGSVDFPGNARFNGTIDRGAYEH